ncbi:hypothetical protein [Polymorphobacter megasporae]|uniref:hypothetical protein n=1 Tax=Glacieibacterium megasporae TaxID=2835787 RepID=UPI001C1E7109|nr:hypothetical protein [Polymorphobacter megasporae]UAJ10606.1 hypothetical protein KTC28_02280 [Polymorphobacter megasporae]
MTTPDSATRFQRFILPGLAFKAVVIGGGYATGRELPAGPWGGVAGMILATLIWSSVAATTFAFAHGVGAGDYRALFAALLGRGGVVFEISYLLFVVVVLAVFGAAAGAIGAATLGAPQLTGTLALATSIVVFATFGNAGVERLFKYVSLILYGVYAVFLILAVMHFGGGIRRAFVDAPPPRDWVVGGVTYASYNIVGAVVVLPVLRHLTSRRDAIAAGLIAGPLAMAPAIVFFVAMTAFLPGIASATLPSDTMLSALGMPAFRLLFQTMIFAALLESGTGAVHAIVERIAHASRRALGARDRAILAAGIVTACIFVADRFGLVALIARGYRALAVVFLIVYVLPLLTLGLARLLRTSEAV